MKILLVGSGGREHSLAWKLAQSENLSKLIVAPGNPGIAEQAECVSIGAEDVDGLVELAVTRDVDLVVVGPEAPLAKGLVDQLAEQGIAAFGPSQAAAQLESSKAFMKDFCKRNNIPTARYEVFTDEAKAKAFLDELEAPYVIKTDGLAAGKGVAICETREAAEAEISDYMSGKFGGAGKRLIIEEFMQGEEASFFALCDGKTAVPLIAAQDHKRVGDGDSGPNTGGMGAYTPAPVFTDEVRQRVMDEIVLPTVKGMAEEGYPFVGVLFAGLMITEKGPRLIEYNIRFGDPECQVVMRAMKSDLASLMMAAAKAELDSVDAPEFDIAPLVNVVMCTSGYPSSYENGSEIKGVEKANKRDGVIVFHAGTKRGDKDELLASGGRVLNVTATGSNLREAVDRAYQAIDEDINWPEGFCRRDIAWRAL